MYTYNYDSRHLGGDANRNFSNQRFFGTSSYIFGQKGWARADVSATGHKSQIIYINKIKALTFIIKIHNSVNFENVHIISS